MQIVQQSAIFSHTPSPVYLLAAPTTRYALPEPSRPRLIAAPRIAGLLPAPIQYDDPLYDTDLPDGWQTYEEAIAELDPLMQRIRTNLARLGRHDLIEEYLS